MPDFSNMTYEDAGVSITAQNNVNAEVARRLKRLGMKAEGLFGGAVDVSEFKGRPAFLNLFCAPHYGRGIDGIKETGSRMFKKAYNKSTEQPIGALDYIASAEMGDHIPDFVEGVATAALEARCPVLGGESAEMKDIYKEGKLDACVHLLTISENLGAHTCDITELIRDMEQPLVVATTDGTGTKTKIVRTPEDIIYHGFNDISAQGVKPIAFALYIAGNTNPEELEAIAEKSKTISQTLGVDELQHKVYRNPDYLPGEVDIAGTVIGVIDKKDLITGSGVGPGDVIVGINVDGLMTNGYTLARSLCDKLVEMGKVKDWDTPFEELEGRTLRYELSRPHRPMTDILFGYENTEGVLSRFKGKIKGMAHITGGGQPDNITRMVPNSYIVEVIRDFLTVPPIMQLFRQHGLSDEELYKSFNMGVGYTLTVSKNTADGVVTYINENFRKSIEGVDREAEIIGYVKNREPRFKFI